MDEASLKTALGAHYSQYQALVADLAERGLEVVWRYYNDYKDWLGKITNGKKNYGWVAVADNGFTVTAYFPARVIPEMPAELAVLITSEGPAKKFQHIITLVNNQATLHQALAALDYKIHLR